MYVFYWKDDFKNLRDTYSLDEPTDSPSKSIQQVFPSNRQQTVQTTAYIRHAIIWSDLFSYPTTHPIFIAPPPTIIPRKNSLKYLPCSWCPHISQTITDWRYDKHLVFIDTHRFWWPGRTLWDSNAWQIYLHWFGSVRKRWKATWIRRRQPHEGGCHASNSSRLSSFLPRICLIFPILVKLKEIWRHHFHLQNWWVSLLPLI